MELCGLLRVSARADLAPACASLCHMNLRLSPIVVQFDAEEQGASHHQWFRAKVEEALRSEKPRLPHDAAMAKVRAVLEERRKKREREQKCL